MTLEYFNTKDSLHLSATKLFRDTLRIPFSPLPEGQIQPVDFFKDINCLPDINHLYTIGMVSELAIDDEELTKEKAQDYDGIIIIAVQLAKALNRSSLALIARQVNQSFNSQKIGNPAIVLFRYDGKISIATVERETRTDADWREGMKLRKVSMLKDIDIDIVKTHTAHKLILLELGKHTVTTYEEVYNHWIKTLNTKELNDRFYQELFQWYLYAKDHVVFPNVSNDDKDKHTSEALIRFISRLLFVWFMKEKKLIDDRIFLSLELGKILKKFDVAADKNTFYTAILQNLFFATLNVPINERKWIEGKKRNKAQIGDPLIYRFEKEFENSTDVIENIFMKIPFLNGGLFDCLDDRKNNVFIDGFTKSIENQPKMPNFIFFGKQSNVDLSHHFSGEEQAVINKWKNKTITGIIDLLHEYKFTVEENTPLEIDVALDPELLGKVFENLLASYNPETKATARKQTGSFYTPREIVNYMVDESLIEYLKQAILTESSEKIDICTGEVDMFGNSARSGQLKLEHAVKPNRWLGKEKDFKENLRILFNHDDIQPFDDDNDKLELIEALHSCKILDPACGSGAFPMGILHKMVELMTLLDPKNKYLKQIEGKKLDKLISGASQLSDTQTRNQTITVLQKQKDLLQNAQYDYIRKLYIIENCIYGVDIQPIAIQISKLRFFISLLVEQEKDINQDNYGIEPLPNMDFKLVAANTLIAPPQEDKGTGLFVEQNEFFNTFERLAHDYFTLHSPADKKQKKTELEALIQKKVEDKIQEIQRAEEAYTLHGVAKDKKSEQELVKLNQTKELWQSYPSLFKEQAVGFFDTPYFFPKVKDGFDVVIGNPPYGASLKGQYRQKVLESLGKVPDYEIYYFFVEVSRNLLKENGVKSYIIPNTFLFNVFASNYRIKLLKEWDLKIIDCTAFKIFESATVFNAITIFKKSNSNTFVKYKPTKNKSNFSDLINISDNIISKDILIKNNQNWSLAFNLDSFVLSLIVKIKVKNYRLIEFFSEISQGMIAYDKYQGQDSYTIKNRVFHFSSFSKNNLKKFLWGSDVNRYSVIWNNEEWLDYCDGIANPREPKFFKGNRILIREITNPTLFAAFTNEEMYHDPAIIVILESERFPLLILLGILNSKFASFFHFNSSPKATKGAFPKVLVEDVKNFPIPEILNTAIQPFIELVNQILADKKEGLDTTALEHQIDVMVYHLYELSYEEAQVIDKELSREDYERYKLSESR
jgi:hypothetical protein